MARPMPEVIMPTTMPTKRDTRPPYTTRLKESRPYMSVPNQ